MGFDSSFNNGQEHQPILNTKGTSEWEGWGTALKPSHEPIVLARKPLSEKSVALNVLKWGTGGLNIDDCRIEYKDTSDRESVDRSDRKGNMGWRKDAYVNGEGEHTLSPDDAKGNDTGRWPANIIFDEEAGIVLDQQSGISGTGKKKIGKNRFFYCPKASKKDRDEGLDGFDLVKPQSLQFANDGSFKENKTSKSGVQNRLERHNNHPTVKPTELMLYLIKLITPIGGTVLDPFMGSGSTGKGAIRGGFDFIGIEREEEYIKIAEARINNELK
jgi:site-specific DNA-methyltransferase (adenine-specific)